MNIQPDKRSASPAELSGAAAIVGCYMALREDDILPDEELLMGCWPQVFHLERAF